MRFRLGFDEATEELSNALATGRNQLLRSRGLDLPGARAAPLRWQLSGFRPVCVGGSCRTLPLRTQTISRRTLAESCRCVLAYFLKIRAVETWIQGVVDSQYRNHHLGFFGMACRADGRRFAMHTQNHSQHGASQWHVIAGVALVCGIAIATWLWSSPQRAASGPAPSTVLPTISIPSAKSSPTAEGRQAMTGSSASADIEQRVQRLAEASQRKRPDVSTYAAADTQERGLAHCADRSESSCCNPSATSAEHQSAYRTSEG